MLVADVDAEWPSEREEVDEDVVGLRLSICQVGSSNLGFIMKGIGS